MSNKLAIEFRYNDEAVALIWFKGKGYTVDGLKLLSALESAMDYSNIKNKETALDNLSLVINSIGILKFKESSDVGRGGPHTTFSIPDWSGVTSGLILDPLEIEAYKNNAELELIYDIATHKVKADMVASIEDSDINLAEVYVVAEKDPFIGQEFDIKYIEDYIDFFNKHKIFKYGGMIFRTVDMEL